MHSLNTQPTHSLSGQTPVGRTHLDNTLRWFAVYTRYKREKYICNQLQKAGVHCYVPLIKHTRRYSTKVRIAEIPLIHCYVFTKIRKDDYITVLNTPGVVDFVKFSNDLISIPEPEIKLMQRVVGEVDDVELVTHRFEKGDEVEIIAGKLTGIRGFLLDKKTKKYFLIELERIGYSLQIEVDAAYLRKTGKHRRTLFNTPGLHTNLST